MVKVTYKGKEFECAENMALLDSISQQGTFMPYSCKGGFCQACMVKAVKGTPPKESQEGISESLKSQGCFLPCICRPTEDLTIEDITSDNIIREVVGISPFSTYSSTVLTKSWLNHDVLRLFLVKPEGFSYKAGQFINIVHPETQVKRSYSLASIPCENFLELHIRRVPDGQLSNWICDDIDVAYDVIIEGPAGECYYQPGKPSQPLILAGISTGLAPLYGIARDALEQDHEGDIYIFHASLTAQGLYYAEELNAMSKDSPNLHYIPCVLKGDVPANGLKGAIDQLIVKHLGDCSGMGAYLCGDGAIVAAMRQEIVAAGVDDNDIFTDAFTPAF